MHTLAHNNANDNECMQPNASVINLTGLRVNTCRIPCLSVCLFLQIIFEGMLEDVNNVLNSGDVPNLYGPEEMETIMTTCRRDCLAKRIVPTKINIFAQYLIRVRQNIHVVVTMSPMSELVSVQCVCAVVYCRSPLSMASSTP